MKKLLIFILFTILVLGEYSMEVKAEFEVTPTLSTIEVIDGVTHGKIVGTIENEDGVVSNQVINYLSANPKSSPTLNIIVGDAYPSNSYGTANLQNIITSVNDRYDNYEVIGGINGDYYNMVVGIPVEAYVRNFEVLSSGLGYQRPVIGFKDNGEVIIGRPCFEGMELLIYNNNDELRHRVPIEKVNKLPFSNLGTSIFFGDYDQVITTGLTKMIIDTKEFKTDGYKTRYFGSGYYETSTTDELTVPNGKFVVVSDDRYVKDLIQQGDYVVAQEKIGCDFEDVRFAIGTWEKLVEDSVAVNYMSTGTAPGYKNPRTAFGIKGDGTVILLTVDGRQSSSGMDGMSLYDLGDLMVHLGAVTAYSLDGGGSTTMSLKSNSGSYEIVNSPSDGGLRNLSNGIFFVKGQHKTVKDQLPLPDLSDKLPTPANIYIDENGILNFGKVDNSEGYMVEIDGVEYETKSRDLPLNLSEGDHSIRIKAIGDGLNFSDSAYSELIQLSILREDMSSFVDLFKKYSKSETN